MIDAHKTDDLPSDTLNRGMIRHRRAYHRSYYRRPTLFLGCLARLCTEHSTFLQRLRKRHLHIAAQMFCYSSNTDWHAMSTSKRNHHLHPSRCNRRTAGTRPGKRDVNNDTACLHVFDLQLLHSFGQMSAANDRSLPKVRPFRGRFPWRHQSA